MGEEASAVVDDCKGDSGGPLTFEVTRCVDTALKAWEVRKCKREETKAKEKKRYQTQLLGIVSWGAGCGTVFPQYYTKVSYYMNWIKQNTYNGKNLQYADRLD